MPRLSVYFLRAALVHLGVGFTLGALMLSNKGVPFAPVLWRFIEAHVEFVFIGWTMQLAIGVALWILPRLSGEHKYGRESLGWWALVLINAGVIAVALGRSLGAEAALLALAGRVAEMIAVVLFAVQIWPRVRALTDVLPKSNNA